MRQVPALCFIQQGLGRHLKDFTEVFMEDKNNHYIILDCKLLEGKDMFYLIYNQHSAWHILTQYLTNK